MSLTATSLVEVNAADFKDISTRQKEVVLMNCLPESMFSGIMPHESSEVNMLALLIRAPINASNYGKI